MKKASHENELTFPLVPVDNDAEWQTFCASKVAYDQDVAERLCMNVDEMSLTKENQEAIINIATAMMKEDLHPNMSVHYIFKRTRAPLIRTCNAGRSDAGNKGAVQDRDVYLLADATTPTTTMRKG